MKESTKNKNIIKLYKYKINILFNFILIFLLFPFSIEKSKKRELNSLNTINIILNGPGIKPILNKFFSPIPDIIWVNDEERNNSNSQYNEAGLDNIINVLLKEGENKVKMGWYQNNSPKSCHDMFNGLTDVISIDLSEFDSSGITDMSYMFKNCISLISLNLDKFNTSSVTDMNSMFSNCQNLKSLDLTNLDTSSVTSMEGMFSDCMSLKYLNLSNLNTKSLEILSYTFNGCTSLKFLDLSNINTKSVKTMSYMFNECTSLSSLNLSSFDTKLVIEMEKMFNNAKSLKSLDLSNFNTPLVTNMKNIFTSCESLTYLDISNFNTSSTSNMVEMFSNCKNLQTIDISNFISFKKSNMNGMFKNCEKLVSLIFPTSNKLITNNMGYMFSGCNSLTSLDLSRFDTSLVTTMEYMFSPTNSLISVNLSNIDSSSVINFGSMFKYCPKLETLDISNLNLSSTKNMDNMFNGCYSLLFLNLRSLNLSNINIDNIFENINDKITLCYISENEKYIKEKYPNIKNECNNTCFSESSKLIKDSAKCVDNCNQEGNEYKYEYNNKCYRECPDGTIISQINEFLCEKKLICNYYNIDKTQCFDRIPEGYFLSDKDNNIIDKCNEICKTCKEKSTETNAKCLTCKSDYFFYNGNCLINCENGYFIDDSGNKKCKCLNYIKCKECSFESINKDNNLCISCNNDYYPKYDEYLDGDFINCYKDPVGYYLSNNYYYPCYSTCKKCFEKGDIDNHNCEECIGNLIFLNESNREYNCYENCYNFYYFNSQNEYVCTNSKVCPKDYNKLINEKNKCIDECIKDDTYRYEYNNVCYKECPNNTISKNNICIKKNEETDNIITEISQINKNTQIIETSQIIITTQINKTIQNIENSQITENEEITKKIPIIEKTILIQDSFIRTSIPVDGYFEIANNFSSKNFFLGMYEINELKNLKKDDIIRNIREDIIRHNIDSLLLNITGRNKEDLYIKEENVLYQITTTDNQNNNTYKNISTIKLGECENILKEKYKIDKNQTLIIFKIDYFVEGLLIPIIGYEVYHPKNKSKLDLSYCEESSISYNIPVSINEDNLYKYDPNSNYYNDECNKYTTENGTDIILNDRKEEFIENNMSLCENICTFTGYDSDTKKALCECGIKYKEFLLSEDDKEKNLLANDYN